MLGQPLILLFYLVERKMESTAPPPPPVDSLVFTFPDSYHANNQSSYQWTPVSSNSELHSGHRDNASRWKGQKVRNISLQLRKYLIVRASHQMLREPVSSLYTDRGHRDYPSVQFSLVAQSSPTLCNPIDCSTPGFLVHHQLPELTQTHFHWVGDTIQPSHPLSSPSSPAFNLSQHQGLFKWVSSLHQVA